MGEWGSFPQMLMRVRGGACLALLSPQRMLDVDEVPPEQLHNVLPHWLKGWS